MKRTKRKSKILFAVAMILILISTMVMPAFADQLGSQPWQGVNNLSEVLPSYAIPADGPGPLQNRYTLILDIDAIKRHNQSGYEILTIDIQPYGTDQVIHDWELSITQNVQTHIKHLEIRSYDNSPSEVLLNIENLNEYDKKYLLIPFHTILGEVLSQRTFLFTDIYNNNQYTTATEALGNLYQNGYNQGEQDATDALEAGTTLITSTVEAPFNVLRQMLNFEILGVNIFGFTMALFTIALVTAVIKFIV